MRTVATPDLTGDFYTVCKTELNTEWKPVRTHYPAQQ
jgi:hypothetical protein